MNKLSWKALSREQQMTVMRRFAASFSNGGYYDSVEGEVSKQRRASMIELNGEDKILVAGQRAQVSNLMRQEMRNSGTARTLDQQRRVNVVGLVGGKLTLTFPKGYEDSAAEWQNWFNKKWAPQAEFTDGLHFNDFLKLFLSSGDRDGDVTLLFDDGLLEDSGRIRAFESDEQGNLDPEQFEKRFGKMKWTQSQGRIYNANGRSVGVIVSSTKRGCSTFPADQCFVLVCDPNSPRAQNFWLNARRVWRFNQGRGVSPLAAAINTLIDLHEIIASEIQAAKLNSKMVAQILDESEEEKPTVPNEFAPGETTTGDIPPSENADAGSENPAEEGAGDPMCPKEPEAPEISFESYKAIGATFDLMPPKLKMSLLDTKRPNPNMQEFINWLAGSVSSVFGMGRVYMTLNPEASYTAFRGAQCLSWPSIEEAQKEMERSVADWAGYNAIAWAAKKGLVDVVKYPLPAEWWECFSWAWPTMREVNEVDSQTALQKQLANRIKNYRELLGPDWKKQIDQNFEEEDYFKEHGHLHPAQIVVGGRVDSNSQTSNGGSDTTDGRETKTQQQKEEK